MFPFLLDHRHLWITKIFTGKDPHPLIPGQVRNKPPKFSLHKISQDKEITPEVVVPTPKDAMIKSLCLRWENLHRAKCVSEHRILFCKRLLKWFLNDNLPLKIFSQDLKSCRGIEVVAQIKNMFTRY